ncbi:ABC transporter permease subunit [Dietzia sp. CW19]|uniref:ABC transporter permease subunit n=1 Tax=Dietzia sp. CW19 TaxID=1630634 RepID=UPI0015F9BE92|nr:ABC transporter permease subunit [Dietzia sp. CW19]
MTHAHLVRATLVGLLTTGLAIALLGPFVAPVLGFPDPDGVAGGAFTQDHAVWGTDRLGRDVLARAFHGNLPLVAISVTAAFLSTATGAVIGLTLAWIPPLRPVVRFATDVLVTLPPVLIILVVATAGNGSAVVVGAVTTVLFIPVSSRYLEAASAPLLDSGFVEVARAEGRTRLDVTVREVVPGLSRPLLTELSVRFTSAVYLVSTLAFLGGGLGGGGDDWASTVRDSIAGVTLNPWSVIVPAIGIALLTVPPALLADREGHGTI